MRPIPLIAAASIAMTACTPAALTEPKASFAARAEAGTEAEPQLMYWDDLTNRERPAPDKTFRYGNDPLQIADLWRPAGNGPGSRL